MEYLIAQALLAAAVLSAVYAMKLRRLSLVLLGVSFAGIWTFYVVQVDVANVRWVSAALVLNVVAAAFVLGHRSGPDDSAARGSDQTV